MRLGVLDVGSNTVHLLVVDAHRGAQPVPAMSRRTVLRLAEHLDRRGDITRAGADALVAAVKGARRQADELECDEMLAFATSAVREAGNGAAVLERARREGGVRLEVLSGEDEARLTFLAVRRWFGWSAGRLLSMDIGGGSLELINVKNARIGKGVTTALGGLTLMDASNKSPRAAAKIVRAAFENCKPLEKLRGRTFYAVGGTWRALARLHMRQRNYALGVMHNYVIPARDAADFASLVERVDAEQLVSIGAISAARRPLLAYGAVVLEEIIRKARPKEVVLSAAGVREGLLYERLSPEDRHLDPLLTAAREFNVLRSRAPRHGEDLCAWTDAFMASTHIEETPDEKRLRHAACLLGDIGWRAHPDYRGEQALNIIANASFVGIDHPGRAFLALATSYRHLGIDEDVSPQIRALVSARALDRARLLGAAMRVAYIVTAAMPDVLTRTPMLADIDNVTLHLPADLADLGSDRLQNRLKQLGRLIGRGARIEVG